MAMRVCRICDWRIEEDRADALPDTRLCVDHAVAAQRHGGEFILRAPQRKTLGKLDPRDFVVPAVVRKLNREAMEQVEAEFELRRRARLSTLGMFRGEWQTSDVLGVAHAMLTEHDPAVLPILADALADACCESQVLLYWLRSPDRSLKPVDVVDHIEGKTPPLLCAVEEDPEES